MKPIGPTFSSIAPQKLGNNNPNPRSNFVELVSRASDNFEPSSDIVEKMIRLQESQMFRNQEIEELRKNLKLTKT